MRVKNFIIGGVSLFVAVCLEFAGTTYAEESAKTATVVPFTSIRDGQIVVPLYVDEVGPLQFLLDTGSSRSAISETLAATLGLPLVAQTELVTPAGVTVRPVARVTNLRLGRARAQALLAPTLSKDAVRRLGPGVVGVLGQDFLSRFNYTIDYRHERIIWRDEEAGGDDVPQDPEEAAHAARARTRGVPLERLVLRESEGRFLIELPQGDGDGAPASFVPDSAADGVVLFGRATTNQLLADTSAERGQLVSLEGNRAGRLVVLKHLRVGAAALWNQPAIVIVEADRAADADALEGAPEEDGLLPLSLFASVTFNNRDGYVLIEPR